MTSSPGSENADNSSVPFEFRNPTEGYWVRAGHIMMRRRYSMASVLGPFPSLFFLAYRIAQGRKEFAVGRDADIVIEGFPRCANTFAVNAFRMAQPEPMRIAHHVHSPAQVIRAAKRGLPCLVLIRKPEAAAISLVIRHPCLTLAQTLKGYARFYSAIERWRHRYVLADFDEVTSDFGRTIERVNEQFGTTYVPFEHNSGNVEKCFSGMDNWYKTRAGQQREVLERIVTRPSSRRNELAESLRRDIEQPALRHAVIAAQAAYHRQVGY